MMLQYACFSWQVYWVVATQAMQPDKTLHKTVRRDKCKNALKKMRKTNQWKINVVCPIFPGNALRVASSAVASY